MPSRHDDSDVAGGRNVDGQRALPALVAARTAADDLSTPGGGALEVVAGALAVAAEPRRAGGLATAHTTDLALQPGSWSRS